MTDYIALDSVATFTPTAYAQTVAPKALEQTHFKINGALVIVSGDKGTAQQTSTPFTVSPTVVLGISHFTINGKPVATKGVATALPLGVCLTPGPNGHFKA